MTSLLIAPVNPSGAPFNPAGDGGTGLRYDKTANQFIFNWQTKGLAAGSYEIVLSLADGSAPKTTLVVLTANGGSAVVPSGRAGGSLSDTAGALLALGTARSISDPEGVSAADERAQIAEAIAVIDATLVPSRRGGRTTTS